MDATDLHDSLYALDSEIFTLLQKRRTIACALQEKDQKNLDTFTAFPRQREIIANICDIIQDDSYGGEYIQREMDYMIKREIQQSSLHDGNTVKIGIQGGEGSFNHIAIRDFLEKHPGYFLGKELQIEFLYTTRGVLEALNLGVIQFGQFAIANSTGGIVSETITELGNYRWKYRETYHIPVCHALLIHPDIAIEEVDVIMGHEQALKQTEHTLAESFPDVKRVPGFGEFIDNAAIALAVANGKLPKTVASVGHESLADIYGLKIEKYNIQDRKDNETTFLLVTL